MPTKTPKPVVIKTSPVKRKRTRLTAEINFITAQVADGSKPTAAQKKSLETTFKEFLRLL